MESDLRVTVQFLQPYSHGRREDGCPEWPPSPLRLFQALVASAMGRPLDTSARTRAVAALRWLELQAPPEILAPASREVSAYRLYVPDNVGDKAAKAWSAGRKADLAEYRTEKDVCSLRLQGSTVHYVFRNAVGAPTHLDALRTAARGITHLGWGIDMVAGDATNDASVQDGELWVAGKRGGTVLRWAMPGTLEALERKHAQFLRRLEAGTFRPVSPLTTFAVHPYARVIDPAPRPFAAFRLLEPLTGDRLALDPARRTRDVAAWTRHAVAEVCEGWPFAPARALVHGHREPATHGEGIRPRLSYLPLPTISPRRAESIARVLIVATPGLEAELSWVRAHIAGKDLVWDDKPVALVEPLPESDWVLGRYIGRSDHWSTMTPVILPGHDDRSPTKAEGLLRKAFLQAGLAPETVDTIKELEWRNVAFRPGVELATRYLRPDNLTGPVCHVRVRFAHDCVGPITIGSGRHRGLGLFAIAGP